MARRRRSKWFTVRLTRPDGSGETQRREKWFDAARLVEELRREHVAAPLGTTLATLRDDGTVRDEDAMTSLGWSATRAADAPVAAIVVVALARGGDA